MAFVGNLSGLSFALDSILLDQSYISGWSPCQLDREVFKLLLSPDFFLPNLQRWQAHIGSFTQAEMEEFKPIDLTLKQLLIEKKMYGQYIGTLKKKKTSKIKPEVKEKEAAPTPRKVKKHKAGKNGVPEKWEDYSKIGTVVEGTRFIPFKVPLKQSILDNVSEEVDGKWSVEDLIEAVPSPGLGLVIDLTFTSRYYDPNIFTSNKIDHKKIPTAGHGVPGEQVVDEFYSAVDSLLSEEGNRLVGVHCTHGLNRTGYLVCRYMIQKLGVEPGLAIAAFDKARGHNQERRNYIDHLKTKGWENSMK